MGDQWLTIIKILLIMLASTFGLVLAIMLISVTFKLTWRIVGNIFRFIGETVSDALRLVGSILAAVLFAPMVVLCIVVGRWSASKHYAGAFQGECKAAGKCVYRLAIGNPSRLLGVSSALEGVEKRMPEVVAAAPGKDKPPRRVGKFDGYTIVGSLKGGGSGGKLYIAEPDEFKRAVFDKRNLQHVDQVVIKSFSLSDGSSLPQIVRESRALDAARKLGLVIEHEMAPEQFYYVMRYVPGESLATVTQNLHAMSGSSGLDEQHMRSALGYARDLLVALDAYHGAGLWHKDVKPDNIIVDGKGSGAQAHLVDFGLVTPLRSAMTLTTHGTEYFRDPELVRQALRGVKVHQIDGSKFDVYGAGAVLFSMIENSFPAHGGLSQISKSCPEALRWIVRRSMAEYDRRYPSAAAMLADIEVLMNADDPYAIKPVGLPSVSSGDANAAQSTIREEPAYEFGADSSAPKDARGPRVERAASPIPPHNAPTTRVGRPKIKVNDWWSGKYTVADGRMPAGPANERLEVPLYAARAQVLRAVDDRKPAAQQVKSARKRARQMRNRAQTRMHNHSGRVRQNRRAYSNTPAASGMFAGLLGLAVTLAIMAVVAALLVPALKGQFSRHPDVYSYAEAPDAPHVPGLPGMHEAQGVSVVSDHEHHVLDAIKHMPKTVDAELLVVNDLPQPMSTEELGALAMGLNILEAHGASLVGDLYDDAGSEDGIDAVADLRRTVGATSIDSSRIVTTLRSWIQDRPLDGVIWIARDPGSKEDIMAIMVTERFMWKQNNLDEETPLRMLRVLEANGYVSAENDQQEHVHDTHEHD